MIKLKDLLGEAYNLVEATPIGKNSGLSAYNFEMAKKADFKKRLIEKAKKGILLMPNGSNGDWDSVLAKTDSNADKKYAISAINYLADSNDAEVKAIGKKLKNKYSQFWQSSTTNLSIKDAYDVFEEKLPSSLFSKLESSGDIIALSSKSGRYDLGVIKKAGKFALEIIDRQYKKKISITEKELKSGIVDYDSLVQEFVKAIGGNDWSQYKNK